MVLDTDCIFEILQYLRRPDIVNLAAAHGSISLKVREAYYFRVPQDRGPAYLKNFLLSINMHALSSIVKEASPEKDQSRLAPSRSFVTDRFNIFMDDVFRYDPIPEHDLTLRRITDAAKPERKSSPKYAVL